jgi:hypothetical protein
MAVKQEVAARPVNVLVPIQALGSRVLFETFESAFSPMCTIGAGPGTSGVSSFDASYCKLPRRSQFGLNFECDL